MPVLEGFQVSAETKAIAQQAHIERCRDRMTAWQVKLAHPKTTEDERSLIEQELAILERQLTNPVTRRTLEGTPTPHLQGNEPQASNPLMELVLSLKTQLESVKAQLKGTHGPTLPQPETPPSAEA